MAAKCLLEDFVERRQVQSLHLLLDMFEDEAKNDEAIDAVESFGPKRLADVLVSNTANDDGGDHLLRAEEAQLIAECVRNVKLRNELTCAILIVRLLDTLRQPDIPELVTNQAELVKQICRALGNLCIDNDAAREVVMNNDGLEILLKLIRALLECVRSPRGRPVETEKLAPIVMGCLFNVAVSDECEKRLQHMDVLPLLIDCIACLPGDAGCRATNLLYNLSDSEEWHDHFVVNMPSLLKIVDAIEDEETLDMLVDVMQSVFVKADESDKVRLFEFGLWDHLRALVDRGALVKPAASLMVVMLTDDGCMHRMFDGGKGPPYFLMRKWLDNDNEELQIYGALAIGNFARGDDLCVALAKDGVADQLIGMLDSRSAKPQEREALEHAILAGLRNLLIPRDNKKLLVQSGIVDKLLSLLPIESYVVAFKYLGCVRMLADRQPDIALKLGSNRHLLKTVVAWSRVELHAGVKSEAMRVLCWVLKNNSSDLVRSAVAVEGAVPAIVEMLKSEHTVMRNEAVIALSLLANGNPPEDVRQALASSLSQMAELVATIITANLSASKEDPSRITNEFLENIVTLVINVCLVRREFRETVAKTVETPLNELNRLTRYVLLKDKVCKALHILGDSQ